MLRSAIEPVAAPSPPATPPARRPGSPNAPSARSPPRDGHQLEGYLEHDARPSTGIVLDASGNEMFARLGGRRRTRSSRAAPTTRSMFEDPDPAAAPRTSGIAEGLTEWIKRGH
ncbi:transcriptional regulator [Streptomyces badius]